MDPPKPAADNNAPNVLDPKLFDPNDTYIAVMGVTGSGKSTFIAECCEDARKGIGHGLASMTQEIQMFKFMYGTKTVHLIDTPGFDDTYRTDSDVLQDLAYWLSASYRGGFKLTGVIYLHPITATRMGNAAFKNLRTFQKMCGEKSMKSVILVTTMWSNIVGNEGDFREEQLRNSDEWWGKMIKNDSTTIRHTGSRDSALFIVGHLIGREGTVLELQNELVDLNTHLENTKAGREVDAEILHQREAFEQKLEKSRKEMEEAIAMKDNERIEELALYQKEQEAEIDRRDKNREDIRISFEELIKKKEKEFQDYKDAVEAKQKQDDKRNEAMEAELQDAQEDSVIATVTTAATALFYKEQLEKAEREKQQLLRRQEQEKQQMMDEYRRARQDENRRQQREFVYHQQAMEQQQQYQMRQQDAMNWQQFMNQHQAQQQQMNYMASGGMAGGMAGGMLGMAAMSAGCSIM